MISKTKTRYLLTTALVVAGVPFAPTLLAADNGLTLPEGAPASVDNPAGETVEGDRIGVYSRASATIVTNAGTIRGNGAADGLNVLPEGGITIDGGPATITNGGSITGAGHGISTAYFYNPTTQLLEARAIDLSIANSGTIRGEGNDGVRLIGGGRVTNSGTISGAGRADADGISMYAYVDQDVSAITAIGSIANAAAGTISGARYGAILFDGGVVDNDGTISGGADGLWIQGTHAEGTGKTALVANAGTISGASGLTFANLLASSELVNSGTITGTARYGVTNGSTGRASITNEAGATITGAAIGVYDDEGGIDLVNAGTIRGNGNADGLDVLPEGGVTIVGAPSTIVNSGTISGAGAGITTAYYLNAATGQTEGRATATQVNNSGTISGESNDGIRLIGGGSVTNSGTITGTGRADADGISMFAFVGQANEDYSASVINESGGEIGGARFGVILSGGGDVSNAGDIAGGNGGVHVQGTALNSSPGEDRSGLTASVTNSGSIRGTGGLGGSNGGGYGVGFGVSAR